MNKKVVLSLSVLVLAGITSFFIVRNNNRKDPFKNITTQYQSLLERDNIEVATLAGGCFWCMEGPFEQTDGVEEVVSGFAGGKEENPRYTDVVSGKTGHRESVQVFYYPGQISYQEILDIFWRQIDPTDDGGQFADRGPMYRTAIFYHNDGQKNEAEKQKQHASESGLYDGPIVTEVLPFSSFYPAEDYHQDFYQKSSEYYKVYKLGSGRADFIKDIEKKLGIE